MRDVGESVRVERARLSAVNDKATQSMNSDNAPIVPAQRLLELAGVLSEGAARMHEALRHLAPADRDAVLGVMTSQIGMMIELWTDLVRGVVSDEPSPPSSGRLVSMPRPAESGASEPTAASPQPPPAAPAPSVAEQPPASHTAPEPPAGDHAPPAPATTAAAGQSAAAPPSVDGLTRDELTGVLNRPAGLAALSREMERCRQAGARFVLGYLDIDGMHQINEVHGARAGDELLRKVTAALRATLRSYDVILRLGGDEFLFSLAGADAATAEQRLREFTAILAGEAPGATASVGYAELYPGDALDDLVARAEHALATTRPARPR